jgi:hypothetical protein
VQAGLTLDTGLSLLKVGKQDVRDAQIALHWTLAAMMTLEFRVPISPSAGFFANIRLLAVSLARLGPPYSSARVLVSVGDCTELAQVRAANAWASAYPILWRIVPHDLFEAQRYVGTVADGMLESTCADVIVCCDADICPISRFDELFPMLAIERPIVAGLQAHFSPFGGSAIENESTWRKTLSGAGLAHQPLFQQYSMDPAGGMGCAPPYFNGGFMLFNRLAFERVAPIFNKYQKITVALLGETFFCSQIAFALAIAAAGITTMPLGHAYDCANDDLVFSTGLASEDDIKVIHYLRDDEFDRRSFLTDPAALHDFLTTPKRNRVSERLRLHVASLLAELGIPL